jgi:hypothetical protein
MYINQSSPGRMDLEKILGCNNYLNEFTNSIDSIVAKYTRGQFTSALIKHKSKLCVIRDHLSNILLKTYKYDDWFVLRKRTGDKANTKFANDIYVLAHSISDNIPPCNNLDSLYTLKLQPSGLIQMLYNVDMEVLSGGETLADIAKNIQKLYKVMETLMKDNQAIHSKLDLNSTAISTIQEEIIQIKSNKTNTEIFTFGNTNKRKKLDHDKEFPVLNSSVIPQKPFTRFSDIAKNLDAQDFVSFKSKKSVVKGAKKTCNIKTYNSDRRFNVWLGHVNINEADENVYKLLDEIARDHEFDIKEINRIAVSHNKFKSFKFSIPFEEREKIMNPDIWPEHLAISRYSTPNPNNPPGHAYNQDLQKQMSNGFHHNIRKSRGTENQVIDTIHDEEQ